MKSKKLNRYAVLAAVLFFIGTLFPYAYAAADNSLKQLRTFVDVLEFVKENYVENTDTDKLITGAIKGVVGELDDFSQYLDPKDYKNLKNDTRGDFGGVGMRLQMVDGFVTVMSPMPGTPAFKAGVMPGDRVLFVDEYQDTSPLQLRIFQLLGQIIEGGEKPGRVIYVGDDKQSIYGFRGAVPELTRAGTPRTVGGRARWKHDTLFVCWRSLPAVTGFVNAFFSSLEERFGRGFLAQEPGGRLDIRHALSDEAAAQRRKSGEKEGASRAGQLALAEAVPSLQLWHLAL